MRLEYPQKGVPSWLYRAVPDGSEEGRENLTARLTLHLPTRLTGYLKVALTKSGVPRVREGGQIPSGDHYEAVTALGLGLG